MKNVNASTLFIKRQLSATGTDDAPGGDAGDPSHRGWVLGLDLQRPSSMQVDAEL